MKPNTHKHIKTLRFGLLLLVVMLFTGCGSKLIRGASPMVRMTELSHQDNNISLQLSIRNLNGVPLEVTSIDVGLSTSDSELFVYQGPINIKIAANGTDTWSANTSGNDTIHDLLENLENGEVKSLPYILKGSITTIDEGTLRFEYEGHLYPLPGRPGHFR